MHINTTIFRELQAANAWQTFAALEWKTRQVVLTRLYALASQMLIQTDGLAEQAEREINLLTGSSLLGQVAGQSLRKWADNGIP